MSRLAQGRLHLANRRARRCLAALGASLSSPDITCARGNSSARIERDAARMHDRLDRPAPPASTGRNARQSRARSGARRSSWSARAASSLSLLPRRRSRLNSSACSPCCRSSACSRPVRLCRRLSALPAGAARRTTSPSIISDTFTDGLLVTEGEYADRLRQRDLSDAVRRARPAGSAHGRAAVLRPAGGVGGGLPARAGRARAPARRRGIPPARRRSPATARSAGIASACARSSATAAKRATLWTVVDVTRERAAARERVPGTAARHRFSRPCAGRLLLRATRRARSPT